MNGVHGLRCSQNPDSDISETDLHDMWLLSGKYSHNFEVKHRDLQQLSADSFVSWKVLKRSDRCFSKKLAVSATFSKLGRAFLDLDLKISLYVLSFKKTTEVILISCSILVFKSGDTSKLFESGSWWVQFKNHILPIRQVHVEICKLDQIQPVLHNLYLIFTLLIRVVLFVGAGSCRAWGTTSWLHTITRKRASTSSARCGFRFFCTRTTSYSLSTLR